MSDETKTNDDSKMPEQGDDVGDKGAVDASTAEEVEAELVSEPAADQNDEEAIAEPTETTDVGADHGDEASPDDENVTAFGPGVILFLAFAVTAVLLLGIWQLSTGSDGGSEPASVAATPSIDGVDDAAAQPDETKLGDGSGAKAEAKAAVRDAPAAVGDVGELPNADGAVKIANVDTQAAKLLANSGATLPETSADPVTDGASTQLQGVGGEETSAEPEAGVDQEADNAEGLSDSGDDDGYSDETAAPADDAGEEIASAAPTQVVAPTEIAPEQSVSSATADAEEETGTADVSPDGEQAAALVDQSAAQVASQDAAEIGGLRAEIAARTAKVDELQAALDAERARIAAQEAEMADLRSKLESALVAQQEQANAEIAQLRAQLADAESRATANAAAAASEDGAKTMVALGALERAVDDGRPFAAELNVFSAFAPDAPAIAALRKYARSGVATVTALRLEFAEVARTALAAAGQESASGPIQSLAARARSLVSIRPAEPVEGDTPGAIISRVEFALEEGRIEDAVGELANLPDSAAAAADEWIARANTRIEADRALQALAERVSEQLPK